MKLGIVLYSKEAEVVFNAFRLANFSLDKNDDVSVFLLAGGVEFEKLDNEQFPIIDLANQFLNKSGKILACGTCLKLRSQISSELCPISTMSDLYDLVYECDKTISF